jgi:hypothetical protein
MMVITSHQRGKVMDPYSPDPIVVAKHESEYTQGELAALLAPVLGVSAEDIGELALVFRMKNGLLSFGGSQGIDAAKELVVDAIVSGVLNYQG